MSINIGGGELRELKPRILVLGVGGSRKRYERYDRCRNGRS